MCDSWIALPDATASGGLIIAKNSDRPVFDCQPLVMEDRREWTPGSMIRTTYREIPQQDVTFKHIGSSPYWCWGYEQGLNEHGVYVGNHAIFTKALDDNISTHLTDSDRIQPGMLGMDLVRLALERARTAHEAVRIIGSIVHEFGQFGSGVPTKGHVEGSYDNSYLITDGNEGWMLETAGHEWIALRLEQGTESMSNQPCIRDRWTEQSHDVIHHAVNKGWWSPSEHVGFDFARAYINPKVSRQVSQIRRQRTRQLLSEMKPDVTMEGMWRIARDHYEDTFLDGPYFDAADPDFLSVCMHVSPAGFTWGNTATSTIIEYSLEKDMIPIFWWAAGPPCIACYVPFFLQARSLPDFVGRAGTFRPAITSPAEAVADEFSPDSFWWIFRKLNDLVKGDAIASRPGFYAKRHERVRNLFDPLEQSFRSEAAGVVRDFSEQQDTQILETFSTECVSKAVHAVQELIDEFSPDTAPVGARQSPGRLRV